MFKDIVTKKSYTKDGEEKVFWSKVGTLKEFDGKQYVELFMFPETSFYVFDRQDQDQRREVAQGQDDLSNIQF